MFDLEQIEEDVAAQIKLRNEFCLTVANAIEKATPARQKLAMFMYQVLINAETLDQFDPTLFCELVGVPTSYATEFSKALALAKIIRQQREFKLVQMSLVQDFANKILK